MFEAAELKAETGKAEFKAASAALRAELTAAQRGLAGSGRSLVVVIGGTRGAGRGAFVNSLLSWLDARGVETHAFAEPTDEEAERPYLWRFWRRLPAAGRTALFLTSWYTEPVADRGFKRIGPARFDQRLDRIVELERMLAAEGVVLAKLWFHLTKGEQGRRLRALEERRETRWRVRKEDWLQHERYGRFRRAAAHALARTDLAEAPWTVIDAHDRRHALVAGARALLERLAAPPPVPPRPRGTPARGARPGGGVLAALDLSRRLPKARYEREKERLQNRLGLLARRLQGKDRSLVLVFEGPDAAGKGGAIRRVTAALDARYYTVQSVAAPTDEEKAHPYLWRFWRALPRRGHVSLHDRSWYGRVLVERVEGLAAPAEWGRAYGEINAFEDQLVGYGAVLLKFWLAVGPEEQLRRFKSRVETPYKQHKITAEDWRNRRRWDAYQAAAEEMIERTGTDVAPWTLVEGDDKRWARAKVLRTVVARLEEEVG